MRRDLASAMTVIAAGFTQTDQALLSDSDKFRFPCLLEATRTLAWCAVADRRKARRRTYSTLPASAGVASTMRTYSALCRPDPGAQIGAGGAHTEA